MYTAIAKAMVKSNRMRNFLAHIPASQSQTLPPQRREPASASATPIDILREFDITITIICLNNRNIAIKVLNL